MATKINSNISKKADLSNFDIVGGSIASNDTYKCENACEWTKYGNIMIGWIHGYITLGGFETYAAYNLPNGWKVKGHSSSGLTNEFGSTLGTASVKKNEGVIFIGSGNSPLNHVYVDGCLTILLA